MLWSNPVHPNRPTSPSIEVCNKALYTPTISLVIMDKLFCQECPSACAAANQSTLVSYFAANHGISLNCAKTDIIKFSRSAPNSSSNNHMDSIPIISQDKCQGYWWSRSLSARAAVEEKISKARRNFFLMLRDTRDALINCLHSTSCNWPYKLPSQRSLTGNNNYTYTTLYFGKI